MLNDWLKKIKQFMIDKANYDLGRMLHELDVYGGLMGRKEFVQKIRQVIKLTEKRKEWIEQSIWNTPDFPLIESLIKYEKQIDKDYNEAVRGGKNNEDQVLWNQGRIDCIIELKEMINEYRGSKTS